MSTGALIQIKPKSIVKTAEVMWPGAVDSKAPEYNKILANIGEMRISIDPQKEISSQTPIYPPPTYPPIYPQKTCPPKTSAPKTNLHKNLQKTCSNFSQQSGELHTRI